MHTRRIVLGIGSLALCVAVYASGLLDVFSEPARLRALADAYPSSFGAIYVALLTLVSGLGIPGIVLMVPAPLVFSKVTAFTLSLFGGVAGSYLSYALARYVLRDFVAQKLGDRFASWDERLEKNALFAIVSMRLMFFLLPPVSFALGLTKVRTVPFLVGTTLGAIPWIAFISFVGGSFLDWLANEPPWVYGLMALLALLGAAAFFAREKLTAFGARMLAGRPSIAD